MSDYITISEFLNFTYTMYERTEGIDDDDVNLNRRFSLDVITFVASDPDTIKKHCVVNEIDPSDIHIPENQPINYKALLHILGQTYKSDRSKLYDEVLTDEQYDKCKTSLMQDIAFNNVMLEITSE